jgi:hypothetical protein
MEGSTPSTTWQPNVGMARVNAAGKDSIYVKGSRQGKERFSVAKKIDSFGERDMDICAFTCIGKNI